MHLDIINFNLALNVSAYSESLTYGRHAAYSSAARPNVRTGVSTRCS